VQPVLESEGEHGKERQPGIEEVEPRPVAEDADEDQRDAAELLRRDHDRTAADQVG
jgi:hypothetical protein